VPKRVLIDHVERDCGLHRPRLSCEEDDVALRDSAPELVIKTVENVRIRSPWPIARHSIGRSAYDRPRPLSPGTSRRRMEENKKERGSKRELEDDRAPSIRRFLHSVCEQSFGWKRLFVIRFVTRSGSGAVVCP